MNWVVVLTAFGGLITLASIVPYLVQIARHKARPRIISWFIWTILPSISLFAAFSQGKYATAVLLFCSSLTTLSVVVFGWKHGNRKITKLDAICLTGALIGLIFWILSGSPVITVLFTVSISFLGGIPTLVHAWHKPYEEVWLTFSLAGFGALLVLITIPDWNIVGFAYPLYLVIINIIFSSVVISRRKHFKKNRR